MSSTASASDVASAGPGAILVSGVPGAGKTTVSRLLAAKVPRSAHLEGDLVAHHFVVGGLVPPQGPPHDEAARQLLLRRKNLCLLADSFADEGFLPIIDDTIVSLEVLDRYLRGLRTRPLALVVLDPSIAAVEQRDAGRHKQVFHLWSHLRDELHDRMPRIGLWVDSTDLDAEATVDRIMADLSSAVIRV